MHKFTAVIDEIYTGIYGRPEPRIFVEHGVAIGHATREATRARGPAVIEVKQPSGKFKIEWWSG